MKNNRSAMTPNLKKYKRKIGHRSGGREKRMKYRELNARHSVIPKFPGKPNDYKQTVSDLVYQYLENLAAVNDRRKQARNTRNIFQRTHVRKQSRDLYPNRRMMDMDLEQNLHSNSKFNVPTYLPLTYETSISQFPRSSASRKIINDYAKAVDEGRNAARKYVCKALSFGVNSGFLVPADTKGQILRVSSNLCLFHSGKNNEKTKIVKKLRYDPECLKNIKTKKLTNYKNKKQSLKPLRTKRLRQVKKKTKKRKTRN